jgi:hypothetical protein
VWNYVDAAGMVNECEVIKGGHFVGGYLINRTKKQYLTVVMERGQVLLAFLFGFILVIWLSLDSRFVWYQVCVLPWVPLWLVGFIQYQRKKEREKELETAKRINAKCKQCEHEFEIVLYPPEKKHRCEVCHSADFSVVDSMPITDDQEPDPPS